MDLRIDAVESDHFIDGTKEPGLGLETTYPRLRGDEYLCWKFFDNEWMPGY